jgi:hypothetical protein
MHITENSEINPQIMQASGLEPWWVGDTSVPLTIQQQVGLHYVVIVLVTVLWKTLSNNVEAWPPTPPPCLSHVYPCIQARALQVPRRDNETVATVQRM